MRRLELVLLFATLFAVGWPAVFGVRPRRGLVAVVMSLAVAVQLQFEGFRWQLLPLYTLALGLAVGDILFVDRQLKWSNRIARAAFGLTGAALAAIPAVVLPVPDLPIPSGPEEIGTMTVELADVGREETLGPNPGEPRHIVAQVWYPAEVTDALEPTVWSEDWDVVAPAMSQRLGLPSWFMNHTQYTRSNGYAGAPIASGTFPVVIYSHGWGAFRTIAVNQIETLVSNGYMVISIDHTYGSVATRFDDGRVVAYDPNALPDADVVGEEAYDEASRSLLEMFADDIVTVLDVLDRGESGPLASLAGSADLDRIGLFGHSMGGGAAIKVCVEDERCDAVLGLDPWVEPLTDQVIRIPLARPALYMRSDGWRGNENDALLRGIAGRSLEETYWLGVDGTEHNDFVATPLFSPIASNVGLRGPIPPGRIIGIIDNYLLGFFDVFLLGTGTAALDNVSFDEVSVEVISP